MLLSSVIEGVSKGQLSSLSNISNHFMQAIFWGIYEKKILVKLLSSYAFKIKTVYAKFCDTVKQGSAMLIRTVSCWF